MKNILRFLVCIALAATPLAAQQPLNADIIMQRTLQRAAVVDDHALAAEPRLRPFYHGVASGDPLADRVILWTRVTPETNDPVSVQWRIATDTAFANVVRRGELTTNAQRDFTVKVDVDGLQPNTTYYYGFSALGAHSLTGRTKTLPVGNYDHARIGVVSCSNLQSGYFNAYARIAERNDLDAVLHLGDYIYEYAADTTGANNWVVQNARIPRPNKEILTLSDYRTRYATYRLDPDLRRLHQQHPFINVWDDHEFANDAWADGAQNHQTEEGDWNVRKSVSKQTYYEWMPIRERSDTTIHRSFAIGDLVDVFMLDTRIEARQKQVSNVAPDAPKESKDSLNNPNRTMLGATQYAWLTQGLSSSTAQWKLLGNQVMFTPIKTTPVDTTPLSASGKLLLPFALPLLQSRFTTDLWSNYPAEQQRLMSHIRTGNIKNVLITTGDFHCGFGFDVAESPAAYNGSNGLACEFLTPSISSTNFDENIRSVSFAAPLMPELVRAMDLTLAKNNPQMKYGDLVQHGYVLLDITRQRTQADWYHVDTLLLKTSVERFAKGLLTQSGESRLQNAATPASPKAQQQIPAPPFPPAFIVSVNNANESETSDIVLLSLYPAPASSLIAMNYSLASAQNLHIALYDIRGREVATILDGRRDAGMHSLVADCSALASGTYVLRILGNGASVTRTIEIRR
ncbi:MAG: alkaline phosphatase D family protein [Candidatus Kapabacteria bacterium]|nr:alkaline phosphatase D family protein [Candidatus Kapabacteria bacterium]